MMGQVTFTFKDAYNGVYETRPVALQQNIGQTHVTKIVADASTSTLTGAPYVQERRGEGEGERRRGDAKEREEGEM
jgi:hypothetical protein